MSIKFTEIQNAAERSRVKELFRKSIPANERAPFFFLWQKGKRENVSFVNICDGDEWVGAIFFSIYKDLVYVWIFAIDENVRSKGYGSATFTEIKRLYPNHRILLGIEVPDENAKNNEQRVKRKEFYERNGFRETGYVAKQIGTSIEPMLIGDIETFQIEELFGAIKDVSWLLGTLSAFLGKKAVRKKEVK